MDDRGKRVIILTSLLKCRTGLEVCLEKVHIDLTADVFGVDYVCKAGKL